MATRGAYTALARITDPTLRAALKLILDRLTVVEGHAERIGSVTTPLGGSLDAAGHLLTQIQDPVNGQDAVNLRTLRAVVQAAVNGQIAPQTALPVPPPVFTPGVPPPTPDPPPPGPPTPPPGPGPDPTPPPSPSPNPGEWPPPQTTYGFIRVAGRTFRAPDGSIYRWRSCTDFRLLQYYYDGVDITPILADRAAHGATMVRVLGMYEGSIGSFNPSNYPNYYVNLPAFTDLCASQGFDVELTVFADAQNLANFNEVTEQRNHMAAVRQALLGKANVVIESCNEPWQNGVVTSNLSRPASICSAAGCGQDKDPDLPPWDYMTFHAARDSEWPRKSHNAMEVADSYNRPCVNDEPIGAAEVAIPGSRSDVPDDFFYFAAVGMLLAGGGTFHSANGIQSQIFQPVQSACANSFFGGIAAIPSDITTGTYTRGPLSDCPIQHDDAKALRTYARYTATQAVCVAVRPTGGWVAIPTGSWVITSQTGPGGCVVYLSR